jgi:hypothetical protein
MPERSQIYVYTTVILVQATHHFFKKKIKKIKK